ncbi:hypothetical protein RclHR1_08070001 [Rhizophagus clarus]|uniref:Uncharacterized protein n=1 Tax=Rhizophagus clarus TaxID=94130 RepID=A0A2Z6SMG4_9GLOM|nr:hypothetical protein RclHR1_19660003 [Rhizophagus clarus]GBC08367.1 hypothetical protein RclHR1_08070001 [Rhizophagus clarus]
MSKLLASITSALESLFGKILSSWEDSTPQPPEPEVEPEPTELPEPEEEPELESDDESDYEIASAYQNTKTTWYSAIWRFLF